MPAIMALTTCAQPCRRWANRRVPGSLPTSGPCPTGSSWSARQSSLAAGRGPPYDHGHDACWPNTACASLERQAPTRADDRNGRYRPGRPRRPRPSSRVAARRIGALDELTRFGHSRRGTPDSGRPMPRCPDAQLDTGHRTPDAGRLHRTADTRTPGSHRTHWTPDTGRVDSARVDTGPHTGHWTSDAAETGQAEGTASSRIFWAITPSGCPLGCRTVFPADGACGARRPMQARGEATTCQCAKLPIALSAAARSLRRPRRLGALLSSTISGRG